MEPKKERPSFGNYNDRRKSFSSISRNSDKDVNLKPGISYSPQKRMIQNKNERKSIVREIKRILRNELEDAGVLSETV